MCCANGWLTIGDVLAGLAVVTGAFCAHGVDTYLAEKYEGQPPKVIAGHTVPASWKYLEDFKTGARYQMYHAFGLIVVGALSQLRPRKSLQIAAWCFLMGILLFSGSLYALTFSGIKWIGAITPIGGGLMIVGWIALAIAACPAGNLAKCPSEPS